MDFNPFLKSGLVKQQHVNFTQIGKQIHRAEEDVKTAHVVLERDPEWAATMAYQAMLRAGRALIYSFGYLPDDGRQHKTVVEITGKILGVRFELITKQFEKLRKKRNLFFYDSIDTGNLAEAKKALDTAEELITAIKEELIEKNPQIKML